MQKCCLNRFLLPLACLSAFALSGCTGPAPMAPQSNLSRENALMMAQRTAEAARGKVFTIAPTGSMKPTLDENSIVTIETVAFGQLRQGDIVIYRNSSGEPIVHRLYERSNGFWLVLGDNNPSVDREAVTPANLLGRVCAIFYTSSGQPGNGPAALAQR
jgi:signal peptidase I